ncbi:PAN2-PAN3 deadenylation complex catalytic subunit PAN2-like isoform X2 [Clavelina lepadiformis]|uniref:PAN2-PAN3 deadenylation complex catalytic subunit PAN2-like isoform X2 n=1 Tax=Clavelina lepadiformis TaxID=159417 RepID=UPI004041CDF1
MFAVGPPDYQASRAHGIPAELTSMPIEVVTEYAEMNVLAIDGAPQFGSNSVHFDSSCELLWVGNQGGHITSYYGPTMQKYTSFQVHPHNPVLEILSHGERVLALTKDTLKCSLKRGVPIYTFKDDSLQDTQCMTLRREKHLLLGGKNTSLIDLDLNTGSISRSIPLAPHEGTAIFRTTSRFLCCGGFNGKIMLRDPDSLKITHTLDAHSGTISDFDANGHTVITCGFSRRPGSGSSGAQHLSLDRFVKMYDLRMMRALSPIQCAIQPSFLRFLATYTRRMLVVSQSGQFLLIEDNAAVTPNTPIYQANLPGTSIVNLDVSPSVQAIGFGDSGGYMHLWSASGNPTFNNFPKDPEFAALTDHVDPININDDMIPLSMVPLPYYNEPLFSDWPVELCIPVSRRPPPIDPDLIRSMKVVHGIGYAPNPGNRRRNQVPYKLKDMSVRDSKGKKAAVPDSPLGRDEQPHLYMVPKKYRKVIFKYSKLGEEENEMIQHYNKTNFAGLEPNIPNAYCNCMLQVLYFIEPLRCGLQSHHNLAKEFDLAEELGFLFHMQDSARSGVLQASNFLRAFRTIPEATALGLLKNASKPEQIASGGTNANLGQLIQNWNRFILQQLHTETVPFVESPSATSEVDPFDSSDANERNNLEKEPVGSLKHSLIEKLFGTEMGISNLFRSGRTSERKSVQFLFNLSYPPLREPAEYVPFSTVLKNSICSQIHTKSWDQETETYQPMVQTKTPISLPDILSLSCALFREEDTQFWKTQTELFEKKKEGHANKPGKKNNQERSGNDLAPSNSISSSDAWNVFAEREGLDFSYEKANTSGWVPHRLDMSIDSNGQLTVRSDTDCLNEEQEDSEGDVRKASYELFATVAHIDDARTGGNLVAHINVGKKYHQRKEGVTHTQWYLFNDIQICAIDKEEAVDFDLKWKVPCILYYVRSDINKRHKFEVDFPLTSDILLPTPSISKGGLRRHLSTSVEPRSPASAMTFTTLSEEEIPSKEGVLVALDAEFVTLNAEEAELHSDGTRSTIKPSHLLLARVTVVRGEGPLEGEPFIDDYIATQEQVVDYLTKFSGIKPGDLDVSISSKHLATLKLTYCKLRYLIQCGCVIVGHGLNKDFKVINIHVPENQIRDTVHLYHMPRKRFVSLRFLAWYFLDEKIQNDMHDSIEDARTALKLYKKYQELTEGKEKLREFQQVTLKKLYDDGRRLEWKVPEGDAS